MTGTLAPIRPITLAEIREARERIAGTIMRTPLVRLELGPGYPDIRLKLENLQPINAYKLRGAANAVALLSEAERQRGVWTISAGNAGQGVAYAARKAGVPCTVVVIETAPVSKMERMKALGARLVPVPYDVAWKALEERAYAGVEGTFVHPFDDHDFIAGHATMGLEILEDAPDTAAVIAGIGGGGLITGVGSAIKALKPETQDLGRRAGDRGTAGAVTGHRIPPGVQGLAGLVRRWGRRPERLPAHVAADEAAGGRVHRGQPGWRPGRPCGSWRRRRASSSEGAGALPLAAALTGKAGQGPIVAIVSGGNIDLKKFAELIGSEPG